jgi:hypothetical protein
MTEAQLAQKFIDWLEGFEIYKEVPHGGIIDIVAVMGQMRLAVEVKCSLNFDVIWQAHSARGIAHYSYAAVPVKRYWHLHPAQTALCRHLGIGVLAYKELPQLGYNKGRGEIREMIAPVLNRRPGQLKLEEYMKRSVAGSQNDRITAFGYFVEQLTETVMRYARTDTGISINDAWEKIQYRHYGSLSGFKRSIVEYCNGRVIKNVEYRDGKLYYKKPEINVQ